jgi:DNA-binding transcriptional LysR family regulator
MNGSRLQLSHLTTFRQLVSDGNFTRASESLAISQPAVTQQIHAVERHFGVKLVEIVGRRMHLTDAGTFFAEHAERVLEVTAALERDMRAYAGAERGELRLGATVTIGSYGLAGIVAQFVRSHPRITLTVRVENTQRIAQAVLDGALSLALVEGPVDDPALEIQPYQDDVLELVVSCDHPFARAKRVRVADLAGEAFVARELGSGTRDLFESVLRSAGIEPRVVLALPTGEGIVQAVEAGVGIAIISSLVTQAAVERGRLRRIALPKLDFRRSFKLVRRKHLTPSPAAQAFAAIALRSTAGR